MGKGKKVLLLVHQDLVPPSSVQSSDLKDSPPWQMEYEVKRGLERLGHEVKVVGILGDLGVVRQMVDHFKPDLAFNLLEEFDGVLSFSANVVAYLELLGVPYTGCNPRGMMLSLDKALSKKLLHFHRVRVPKFSVARQSRVFSLPRFLEYPVIVKSVIEQASTGIAQASIVQNNSQLQERISFIHQRVGTDAIVEQFIEGREIYVPILGNQRLKVLPIWEMYFGRLPEDRFAIATARVKWNADYRKRHGIRTAEAKLSSALKEKIIRQAKRIYRILNMSGYARLDFRLKGEELFFLEANPNPHIGEEEDFALSAKKASFTYPQLIQKIVKLGLESRRLRPV